MIEGLEKKGTVRWSGEHWISYLRRPGEDSNTGMVSLYNMRYTEAGHGFVAFVVINADGGNGSKDNSFKGLCTTNREVADFMVEEGALPWQVDAAIYHFGFAMGPFAVNDLAGIDVRYLTRNEQKKLWPDRRHPVLLEKVYALGRYGQKTDAGWYDYQPGARRGTPSHLIEELIVKTSAELGLERRSFGDQEIVDGYVLSMANTGAQILEEGLALRASDIDVIWHYGYGFPRYRGGPMFYADLVGLDKVYDAVSRLYDSYGDWVKPSELLVSLAKDGKSFADYTA